MSDSKSIELAVSENNKYLEGSYGVIVNGSSQVVYSVFRLAMSITFHPFMKTFSSKSQSEFCILILLGRVVLQTNKRVCSTLLPRIPHYPKRELQSVYLNKLIISLFGVVIKPFFNENINILQVYRFF